MSYYYNYYIGYKDERDGKIYPLGPYTVEGKLKPVISKSRSFASNLYEDFHVIIDNTISEELREEFEYENWKGEKIFSVKYLPIEDLPTESYIKHGYFLIEDVKAYESNASYFEGFFDTLTPELYAVKLQHELFFGKNQPKKDSEGNEYVEPNASDYMYYAYPDFQSKEYEAYLIYEVVDMLRDYSKENISYVILETEG